MKSTQTSIIAVLGILMASWLVFPGYSAAGLHYLGPVNPYASVWIWPVPPLARAPGIHDYWVFSDVSNGTVVDSVRPPALLGGSGPWTFEATTLVPTGTAHAFSGIHYALALGGVDVSSSLDPLLVFPTTPQNISGGIATVFWRDPTSGAIASFSEPVIDIQLPIPQEVQNLGPLPVYQYIHDQAKAPRVSCLSLAPASLSC